MGPSSVSRWLESWLRVRPEEARRVGLMFAYQFAIVSAFVVARTVRDTLFLSRSPLEQLPFLYIGVAVAVGLCSAGYAKLSGRFRHDRVVFGSLLVGAGAYSLAFGLLLLERAPGPIYAALYVLVEVVGGITNLQFWAFANDVFSAREGKRLYGLIGAGGVVANIAQGFAIAPLAQALGTEALLMVSVALLLASLGLLAAVVRGLGTELEPEPHKRSSTAAQTESLFQSPHLRLIAAIGTVTVLAVTFVDYQFKIVARASFPDEIQLAAFFGYFYGAVGLISFVVQFFVTSRVLERSGIVAALLVLPICLGLGTLGLFFDAVIPPLYAITLAKGADNTFRYTINTAATQLLYTPLAAARRSQARAFIEGVLKPAAIGLAGLCIVFLRLRFARSEASDLAIVDLVLVSAWIACIALIRREYVSSLLDALRVRRRTDEIAPALTPDGATLRTMGMIFETGSSEEIVRALSLISLIRSDWRPHLMMLLEHPDSAVRLAALNRLEAVEPFDPGAVLTACLSEPNEAIRAAAIRAYARLRGLEGRRVLEKLLGDPSSEVRRAALTGLVRHAGGATGPARETLARLAASPATAERRTAAQILGTYAPSDPLYGELEEDRQNSVRVAALEGLAERHDPNDLPRFLAALRRPETARLAARALKALNAPIEAELILALADTEGEARALLAEILGVVGGKNAVLALAAALESEDEVFLERALVALSILRERVPGVPIDDAPLQRVLRRGIAGAYQSLAISVDLALPTESLLGEALATRQQKQLGLAFFALEARNGRATIGLARVSLASSNKSIRSQAVEVLDNVLSKEDARILLPLIEDHAPETKLDLAAQYFPLVRDDRDGWLRRMLSDGHPWMVACTLEHIAGSGQAEWAKRIVPLLDAKDPLVRETAFATMLRLCRSLSRPSGFLAEVLALAERAAGDGDGETAVREVSRELLNHLALLDTHE